MSLFQAIILGIAQGLGEFLPISSSAHLILIPWIFKWPDPGLTFDVALHIGTLFAVIIYFWRDWLKLLRAGFGEGLNSQAGRMFWFLIIASIPGALAGALFEKQAENAFRNPVIIGSLLIVMGIFLYLADRSSRKHDEFEQITFRQSMLIGISQALAIVPGVSRSGITMTCGMFVGLKREAAARFSFMLSTPIILGAGLLKLGHLPGGTIQLPFVAGMVSSALVGLLVIGFLLHWLRKSSFLPFVWYRLLLGAAVLILAMVRG